MRRIKRYFITGLIVITPVFATIYSLVFIFRFFDGFLGRFVNNYLKERVGFFIPGLGLFLSLTVVFLTGVIAAHLIGKRVFVYLEKWFSSLPLIKSIYPAFKQLVLFLLAEKGFGFKKVVLVEYPSKGLWSVGFLTNDQYVKIKKIFNKDMVAVFVASSPGPLTGYVMFVAKEDLRFPDISVSEALKIIISGGVLTL